MALWTASKSVGLPLRSPPPVRAATSTFLISLAKSLPRLASMPAFLCFVVAHLEWPLIGLPLSFPAAPAVSARWRRTMSTNSACTRRSPVSSGWKLVATTFPWRTATILPSAGPPTTRPSTSTPAPASSTHGARMKTACSGPSPIPSMARSASKESTCRPKALRRTVTSRPPTVSWSGGGVEQPVGQQDHPGAGAVGRQPVAHRGAQRLQQPEAGGELDHRRRLAARQHQPVDGGQLLGPPDGHGLGALLAAAPPGARGRRPAVPAPR